MSENSNERVSDNSIDSGSNSDSWEEMDIDDESSVSQFTVTLRKSHLGSKQDQYLVSEKLCLGASCSSFTCTNSQVRPS